MIHRYHPQALTRRVRALAGAEAGPTSTEQPTREEGFPPVPPLSHQGTATDALIRETRRLAVQVWETGIPAPIDLAPPSPTGARGECFGNPSPIGADLLAEYGHDAVRLAHLTAFPHPADEILLESAFRWLSGIWDRLAGGPTSAPPGTPDPWLMAATGLFDHLVTRGRPYPALALLRKAWKAFPLGPGIDRPLLEIGLQTLTPFAPVLVRAFRDTAGLWPPQPLRERLRLFPGRRPVRFSFEKGGWSWAVVDDSLLTRHPEEAIAGIPWVRRALGKRLWRLRADPEGWKICFPQTPPTASSS